MRIINKKRKQIDSKINRKKSILGKFLFEVDRIFCRSMKSEDYFQYLPTLIRPKAVETDIYEKKSKTK